MAVRQVLSLHSEHIPNTPPKNLECPRHQIENLRTTEGIVGDARWKREDPHNSEQSIDN